MGLTCQKCGNEESFQVKVLHMHVVKVDGEQVALAEEGRTFVLELLCDEREAEVDLQKIEDKLHRETTPRGAVYARGAVKIYA